MIIALLVASVVAGKSLIKSAQIRAIATQINTLEAAVLSFYDRYNALPGDMSNASTVFGATKCPPSPCNGDGDNIIIRNPTNNQNTETYNSLKHLSLAGLIDRTYDGTNLPSLKYQGDTIYFAIRYAAGSAGTTGIFGRAGHVIDISSLESNSLLPESVFFTPSQAKEIDLKLDDGVANTGRIYGGGGGTGCVGWGLIGGADYSLLTSTIKYCWLAYWLNI